ncbi:ATP-binding protein [Pseudomonas fluorescens]|uniref:histidine kinase n=1 Tax=Pseudomonas fluorescens TaxID=294 RepID=A0A5E7AQY0_PSEFL|nr:ATP-binding protein [Pseudomonas fluorescens]VVN80949.1 Sensor protein FixL [Pseudomonas fluorescens]
MQNTPPAPTFDYHDLFERAPIGYVLLEASGRICKINQTGAALLGWDAAWLTGESFARWVVSADRAQFHAHLSKLSSPGGCVSQKLRVKNRQGRIATLWLKSDREPNACAHTEHFRTAMIDVSGEQESARKLRSLQSQLTRLARLNTAGELASSLAHELNQPLGTVVLSCEAALRLLTPGSAQTDEFIEALTQAREAAAFASDVVRHLRGFLQNNDEMSTDCEFSSLIQEVTMLIEVDARDSDIDLRLDIQRGMPYVRVDVVQIGQVLVNLAHNSIEAMREQGGIGNRLTIMARGQASGKIQVSVTDTGPGLDHKEIERIFSPFYTTKSNGMGLGLSISRTIIEAHGGELWADPGSTAGATVHFTLPTLQGNGHDD